MCVYERILCTHIIIKHHMGDILFKLVYIYKAAAAGLAVAYMSAGYNMQAVYLARAALVSLSLGEFNAWTAIYTLPPLLLLHMHAVYIIL